MGRRELRGEEGDCVRRGLRGGGRGRVVGEGAAWGGGGRVVGEHCDAQEAPGQATCPVRSAASHT